MQHEYNITGMTCSGCVASVTEKLQTVEGVVSVDVTIEKSSATINMQRHIPLTELKAALPSKYTIEEIKTAQLPNVEAQNSSELKQLLPLFLIFGYITAASVLLNVNPWDTSGFMLDFMGLFYMVFSFFKMLDLKNFPASFAMYDPLAKKIPTYGLLYPFLETALGLMFLMRFEIKIALIATILLLGITTYGVTKTLLNKKTIQCACLGTALKLPMTKATFIENAVMLVMAVLMLL